jgi:pimeloyl-ACP methyl ester carboxylesterase
MQHLLLLHGAIGSKEQLSALETELSADFSIHTLNFTGHGGEPVPEEDFSIPLFAAQLAAFIDSKGLSDVCIFGYSMGGYAALYLARHYPGKVARLITLGTKFIWDEIIAAKEVKMLDAQKMEEKVPVFAAELKQRHTEANWKPVLEKTAILLLGLGKDNALKAEDYKEITLPALLLSGDRDKMVIPEETLQVSRLLPAGQLGILPATPHPIEQVNVQTLAFFIRQFLN